MEPNQCPQNHIDMHAHQSCHTFHQNESLAGAGALPQEPPAHTTEIHLQPTQQKSVHLDHEQTGNNICFSQTQYTEETKLCKLDR